MEKLHGHSKNNFIKIVETISLVFVNCGFKFLHIEVFYLPVTTES